MGFEILKRPHGGGVVATGVSLSHHIRQGEAVGVITMSADVLEQTGWVKGVCVSIAVGSGKDRRKLRIAPGDKGWRLNSPSPHTKVLSVSSKTLAGIVDEELIGGGITKVPWKVADGALYLTLNNGKAKP